MLDYSDRYFQYWSDRQDIAQMYGPKLDTIQPNITNYFAWDFGGSEFNEESRTIAMFESKLLKSRETGEPQIIEWYGGQKYIMPSNCEALILEEIVDTPQGGFLDIEDDGEELQDALAEYSGTVVVFPKN